MARAGYCSVCGTNVWLTEDGGCPNGHGPESISNVYEADPGQTYQAAAEQTDAYGQPATAPVDKPRRNIVLILVIVAIALVIACACPAIFMVGGIGLPVFNAAKSDAQQRTCWANQRTIDGAVQMWLAESGDNEVGMIDGDTWPETLVGSGYILEAPQCPAGNPYYLSEGAVQPCPTHGHY